MKVKEKANLKSLEERGYKNTIGKTYYKDLCVSILNDGEGTMKVQLIFNPHRHRGLVILNTIIEGKFPETDGYVNEEILIPVEALKKEIESFIKLGIVDEKENINTLFKENNRVLEELDDLFYEDVETEDFSGGSGEKNISLIMDPDGSKKGVFFNTQFEGTIDEDEEYISEEIHITVEKALLTIEAVNEKRQK